MKIDWQCAAFVAISLLQDYLWFMNVPRIYYWDADRDKAA
jgi:hypothetical protein